VSALCSWRLGYYVPDSLAAQCAPTTRQDAITEALPPTLDLLVTCMEAGLNLEQAIAAWRARSSLSDPEMSEELSVVVGEMRAGLRRARDHSASSLIASPRTTCATWHQVVIQSPPSSARRSAAPCASTPPAPAAAAARPGRERRQGDRGLTLPLTLCLLPAIILSMLGPAIVLIVRSMAGT
jgi:tight adherence protein C